MNSNPQGKFRKDQSYEEFDDLFEVEKKYYQK